MDKQLENYVSEVSTNFKRGTAELLLLTLLTERDWYVYELGKALKERSLGLFDIQGPSMYTVLYRMERRGFVNTWEELVGRRNRVYYHILPDGIAYLSLIRAEYEAVSRGIQTVLDSIERGGSDG